MQHSCNWDFASFMTMIFTFIALVATAWKVLSYAWTFVRLNQRRGVLVMELLGFVGMTASLTLMTIMVSKEMLNPLFSYSCKSLYLITYGSFLLILALHYYVLQKCIYEIDTEYVQQHTLNA